MCAIKTMRTDDEEKVMIAKREYDLLNFLEHSAIVSVLDYFHNETKGEVSIVMERVDG